MDKKPAPAPVESPAATPADPPNPPHGGSWNRKPDGSLELIETTKPAEGRVKKE